VADRYAGWIQYTAARDLGTFPAMFCSFCITGQLSPCKSVRFQPSSIQCWIKKII